jgi:hypothetical protein
MHKHLAVLILHLALASNYSLLAAAGEWSTFQGDAAHTGYVPGSFNPAQFQQVWNKAFPGISSIYNLQPIAVGEGKVFLAVTSYFSSPEELHAFDARSGNELWSTTLVDPTGPNGANGGLEGISPPAYMNGAVYATIAGSQSAVYGFNASSGAQQFSTPYANQIVNYGAPTAFAGNVYSESGTYGGMAAFNGSTGQSQWFTNLQQQNGWSAAVDLTHSYVYMGQQNSPTGTLYALNRTTGAVDYQILDPGSSTQTIGTNSNLMLGNMHDAFVANGAVTGYLPQALVRFDLDAHTISWAVPGQFQGGMAVANGKVYAINNDVLEVRDELTGILLWSWTQPQQGLHQVGLDSNIVVTDSHVFVGASSYVPSSTSNTYAIDLQTHQEVWSVGLGGYLALADNVLYIESFTGTTGPATEYLMAISLAVPEPNSLVLAALGFAGLAAWCWRRRCRAYPVACGLG